MSEFAVTTIDETWLPSKNEPGQLPIGDAGRVLVSLIRFHFSTVSAHDTYRVAVCWNEVQYRKEDLTETDARALWQAMPSVVTIAWLKSSGFEKVQDV
jgi:hypothetical protein